MNAGVDLSCLKKIEIGQVSTVDAPVRTVTARKGVIVTAGAIYTPQLLQVSGVGPADLISKLGVPLVSDLPVGQNFVDRLTWTIQIIGPKALPKFLGYTVFANGTQGLTFESVGGTGVDNVMAGVSLGLVAASERHEAWRPFLKFFMEHTELKHLMDSFSNVLALVHDPKSRGYVEARSTSMEDTPIVDANFFGEDIDVEKQVANMKALINVAKQPAMDEFRSDYISLSDPQNGMLSGMANCPSVGFATIPCPPEDESQWGEWLQDNVLSTYHYFGTAEIGKVVEPGSFKVKGTEGLFVADASVIPRATRINPVGTIMALGHYVGTKLATTDAGRRRLAARLESLMSRM